MSRSKKDIRVINDVKRALDAALSEVVISQDAYTRINLPGLKTRNTVSGWDECPPPPPEPEPEPQPEPLEIPEPEIAEEISWDECPPPAEEAEPEPEPVPEAEYYDAVVVDACVPEVAEEISCTAAPVEETVAEMASGTVNVQETGVDNKEKKKGFVFTTCFRCGRVDVVQYGDRSLPKEVRGECEVDNGIVMTLCGLCEKIDGGSNSTGSFGSDFTQLKLSAELFEGSVVQGIATAVLSQEVAIITDEGGVAYRDVNRMVASLRRDDKLMSVDVERFKNGERVGLVLGFLAGGLIGSVKERKMDKSEEENDKWGFGSSKKKNRLV